MKRGRASAVPEKSFSGYSKTFTSRFVGVQRRDNLQVILLLAKMVRFSLSPKITLTKEKTRKNSESRENNISLK